MVLPCDGSNSYGRKLAQLVQVLQVEWKSGAKQQLEEANKACDDYNNPSCEHHIQRVFF
jgi:hypothetical protein